ncbi:4-hydroxybenzoate transporter PcaK (plasmid) [Variovorax sp. SRS16]|uniref:MFS transporter n=1 Tax=Variovorax sp. SRS16 TaxID=282217 RepID=UPI0013186DA6|nr:MFS transporter [Variovorax sp. SRS16]VTU45471.1 4-hydroxybenzoate transporter PcaK [Variovorax sp. SRS16]
MEVSEKTDVCQLIDDGGFSRFQGIALLLCGLSVLMDGFDVQVIGFVAPAIVQDWKIDKASLGPVFVAGLAGLLVGSLLLSMLADHIGRRPVLIGSTFFFALCMLATAQVRTLPELMMLRFATGLGLGSVLPNAMALAGEYTPLRRRVTVLMVVSVGFTVGAVLAGFVAAAVMPRWGWQAVFLVGGSLPLAVAVAMVFHLPESLQFLVLRGRDVVVERWLRRIDPAFHRSGKAGYRVNERAGKGAPIRQLFTDGRAKMTLLLWGVNLLNLLNLYFLSNWLPTIVRDAGLSLSNAVLAGTALQAGGAVGAVLLGLVIDQAGFRRVLIPCFVVAGIAILLIGRPGIELLQLFAAVVVTGFCIVGGQSAINALAASYYPTALRSTGIGWGLGIGRLGSMIGPIVGAELIRAGLPNSTIFLVLAVPAVLSAGLVVAMGGPRAGGNAGHVVAVPKAGH